MENTSYVILNFSEVIDTADFFRTSGLKEIPKIRSIIDSAKMLFKVPGNAIKIYVAEGKRIYKIVFYKSTLDKVPFAWLVYLPESRRMDLYDSTNPTVPLIQWKNKRPVFKNFTGLLDIIGVDTMFSRLITVS